MLCKADAILFPFLKEASIYAKINIQDALNSDDVAALVDNYFMDIFSKGYHDDNLDNDIEKVMKRFICSIIVIQQIGKDRLKHKYAGVEADHFISKLRYIYNKDSDRKKENFYIYFDMIYRQIFDRKTCDVKRSTDNMFYVLPIPIYLKIVGGRPANDDLKLINQLVMRGHVLFESSTLFEILQIGLARYLYQKISELKIVTDLDYQKKRQKPSKFHPPLKLSTAFKELIKKYEYIDIYHSAKHTIKGIDNNYDKKLLIENLDRTKGGKIPPCIEYVLNQFDKGDMVKHFERLTLAAFLNKRNYSMEEQLEIFSKAPNYKENVTRYQLEHIKNKDYMVSSCDNIKANNFCFRNKNCSQIKNPLQF